MDHSKFPLGLYVSALVRFLDTIEYHDDNYHNDERVKTMRYVYTETAKHFAPLQLGSLEVHPKKLAAVMRTSVQVVVCCWSNVSLPVMVAICVYFVHIVLLDDSNDDPYPEMQSFLDDLLHGNPQKHPFWRLMNGYLPDFLRHYGPFCGLAILRSTFDYFQGYWIETRNFQGFPGSHYYPLFLRRLNGLGGISGGSLFPAEQFDEKALFEELTTAIAEIEPMAAFVNDLFSFYKEFDNPRDQVSLVMNVCQVEGVTVQQSFDRLTDDAIRSIERLREIFDAKRTPAVVNSMHAFVQGYATWHLCDERYRMREVYERCGETPHGTRFRHYYEAAVKVAVIDFEEWAVPTVMINDYKESPPSTETSNENLLGLQGQDIHVGDGPRPTVTISGIEDSSQSAEMPNGHLLGIEDPDTLVGEGSEQIVMINMSAE